MRVIAHLDLDCFFVSCERIKNPQLAGKPVIVGGNPHGRGVVSTASYEARRFGVRSAMPSMRARALCPKGIFLRPDFDLYSNMSNRVARFLRSSVPVVEQASIDEFYLDLTGCERVIPDLTAFGVFVKGYLAGELKLPCTMAIASNKLVAKIAVEKVKPDGFIRIEPGREAAFLDPLPIGQMPGIGKVTERQMMKMGFKTLGDVARAPAPLLEARLGKWGMELARFAGGVDERPVTAWEDPKSISRETTFENDIGDPDYLLSVLSSFTEECCAELRGYRFKTRRVTVKFRLPDFTTFERSVTVAPTHHEEEVFDAARKLFLKIWNRGMKLRLVGVGIANLRRDTDERMLFSDPEEEKKDRITRQVDQIRTKYGFEAIRRGNSLRAYGP